MSTRRVAYSRHATHVAVASKQPRRAAVQPTKLDPAIGRLARLESPVLPRPAVETTPATAESAVRAESNRPDSERDHANVCETGNLRGWPVPCTGRTHASTARRGRLLAP